MSVAVVKQFVQPDSFSYTDKNMVEVKKHLAKYPENRKQSAVLPLLHLAQKQEGWVSKAAMDYIANMLGLAPIRVYEVATFYTMFNLEPKGKYLLQVCTTTPCWLRGSDEVMKACQKKLGIGLGETTADGKFSLMEVECLGACVNAPIVQVNNEYFYEDLDAASTARLIDDLAADKNPPHGSAIGRQGAAPIGDTGVVKADKGGNNNA